MVMLPEEVNFTEEHKILLEQRWSYWPFNWADLSKGV